MNNLICTKNCVFISLVGRTETDKSKLVYNLLNIGTFQPKFDKMYFFYHHSQPLYDVMQKKIDILEFFQGVNLEFLDSLKNATNYLLIVDDSCDEICNSKAFVQFATAGRHHGLNTIYFKHNLFFQNKLWRDVELRTRTLLSSIFLVTWCKSWRLVHSWASDQNLMIGIETQRLYPTVICWLTCRLEQAIDYVIAQIPDPFPQKIISRPSWKDQKFWTINAQSLSALQVF